MVVVHPAGYVGGAAELVSRFLVFLRQFHIAEPAVYRAEVQRTVPVPENREVVVFVYPDTHIIEHKGERPRFDHRVVGVRERVDIFFERVTHSGVVKTAVLRAFPAVIRHAAEGVEGSVCPVIFVLKVRNVFFELSEHSIKSFFDGIHGSQRHFLRSTCVSSFIGTFSRLRSSA